MANKQNPVKVCTYKFPSTDVYVLTSNDCYVPTLTCPRSPSFVTLSSVLEGVGTSAYLGAAGLITSKDYLTVAGSILAVEALHTSLQRAAVGAIPMANALETVSPNRCFTPVRSLTTYMSSPSIQTPSSP